MPQRAIPFLFMRGGTSRGPYFRREHLPEDRETLAEVLIAVLGAGHAINIDGIGGGVPVTTKAAMLSRSEDEGADVDFFFAQVAVAERLVDFKPSCGNILAGVGPAAVEMGLVPAGDPETRVRIRAVNTDTMVEAVFPTPGGRVAYAGDCAIAGVPGTGARIVLNFTGAAGSVTGAMLPTGAVRETVEGAEVTCLDVAMPVVIARAADFGVTGHETKAELDANAALMARIEAVRLAAGVRMGMGDVSQSVTPKFALLAAPRAGGTVAARYFMPWECHPSMAVTGGQCIGTSVLLPGSVAEGLAAPPGGSPAEMAIEHPSGRLAVLIDHRQGAEGLEIPSAGVLRTARLLARGEVFVPAAVWPG